eukprot:gene18643-6073_t
MFLNPAALCFMNAPLWGLGQILEGEKKGQHIQFPVPSRGSRTCRLNVVLQKLRNQETFQVDSKDLLTQQITNDLLLRSDHDTNDHQVHAHSITPRSHLEHFTYMMIPELPPSDPERDMRIFLLLLQLISLTYYFAPIRFSCFSHL